MDRERSSPDPDEEDDLTEVIVAADDTGLVRSEIEVIDAEIEVDAGLPAKPPPR